MANEVTAKRGDTFGEDVIAYADDAMTQPRDLTGVVIACQGKHTTGQKITFSIAVIDAANGLFRIEADAATTATWPPGLYDVDIEFKEGVAVNSTDTFRLNLLEDITNAN